ncbi:MAG: DUF5518 domain-containing protein [Candidatus Micrarchaeota archaeon]|nr:DUF5518 domain-containing protein [Candidatus Micrarchaeota archaeon]
MERGVVLGTAIGLVAIVFLGWVPVVGALVSGYMAGINTSYRKEGIIAGFVVGAIGSLILTWAFFLMPSQVFVVTEGPLSGWVGQFFTKFYTLGPLVLIATTVACSMIGGAIGSLGKKR